MLFLAEPVSAAQSFFVTVDKVELKGAGGKWVSVIEPDRKVDLMQEEATISFFNNGRVPPDDYSNVRVSLTGENYKDKFFLERKEDFEKAVAIKKGSFVNVSFEFDFSKAHEISQQTVKQIHLTVDEEERIDGGDNIKVWS